MAQSMRVSLSSYNALTDTNPLHYALFADQDNVLIKEHSRGSESVNNGATDTITHSLGYTPHVFVYTPVSAGRYKLTNGYDVLLAWQVKVDSTNLSLTNSSGSTGTAKWFIFYDNID